MVADSNNASKTEKARKPSRVRRVAKWLGAILGTLLVGLVLTGWLLHEARPETGEVGEAADAMARQIEVATGQQAWSALPAVRWTFRGAHEHLWDRERNLAEVRWDDHVVLLRIYEQSGAAFTGGQRVEGEAAAALIDKAHALFINDSYWLNPFSKLFDPGVTRSTITTDEGRALFFEFSQGGRTPGDGYAVFVDDAGRPKSWKMWVSILPIGGIRCSWDGWQELEGGAWTSTLHDFGMAELDLGDVQGGTLQSLGRVDAFDRLD